MSGGGRQEKQVETGGERRTHRQAYRARRPCLAARRGADDRGRPRQAERPLCRHAGDDRRAGRPDRGRRRAARRARARRASGSSTSRRASSPPTATRKAGRRSSPRCRQELPRVMTVGRLDINTEGLLLLTNDGGLARVLELPATGWLRRYRVRAHGQIEQAALDKLRRGVTIDGMVYGAIEADHRPRAGHQCLADGRPARRQEPRGQARARASRALRHPADPHLLRALPARRL